MRAVRILADRSMPIDGARGGCRLVAPRNLARAMPSFRDVDDYLEDAWVELHAANDGLGWSIGRPAFDPHKVVPWSLYAFDRSENAKVGRRSREWTAMAATEIAVVLGRWPAACGRSAREGIRDSVLGGHED